MRFDQLKYVYLLFLLSTFLLFTNRFVSIYTDPCIVDKAAGDSFSYCAIATHFPQPLAYKIPFHHAQRFTLPYLAGKISRETGVSIESTLRTLVSIVLFWGVCLTYVFVRWFGIGQRFSFAITGLIFINPYLFRIPLTFPFMANDPAFVVASILTTFGLLSRRATPMLVGVIFGILFRQTMLLLAAPILFSWALDSSQNYRFKHVKLICVALLAGGYVVTSSVARTISSS
ncbi:hypothetical protein EB093_10005, partial [bacterium]|nr:hypothetical protein [bacterium]